MFKTQLTLGNPSANIDSSLPLSTSGINISKNVCIMISTSEEL